MRNTHRATYWKHGITSNNLIAKIYNYFKSDYGTEQSEVDKMLSTHKIYRTLIISDKAMARFNVSEDGLRADVLDAVVVEGGLKTLREMMRIGKKRFPTLTTITWGRSHSHPNPNKPHEVKTRDFNKLTKE